MVYDGVKLIEERYYDHATLAGKLIRRYYYEEGINKLAMIEEYFGATTPANVYIPLTDERGTLMGVIDGKSGNATYGQIIEKLYYNSTGLCKSFSGSGGENTRDDGSGYNLGRSQYIPFGWCGMYRDPFTGHYHTHFRDYDPIHARWLSEDPAGYKDGLNLYAAYMGVNGVDKYGLDDTGCFGSAWGDSLFADFFGSLFEYEVGGKAKKTKDDSGLTANWEWQPPKGGFGGRVGGRIIASTLRLAPVEKNPSPLSLMGIDDGARQVPYLDSGMRLYTGETAAGFYADPREAGIDLLLECAPLAFEGLSAGRRTVSGMRATRRIKLRPTKYDIFENTVTYVGQDIGSIGIKSGKYDSFMVNSCYVKPNVSIALNSTGMANTLTTASKNTKITFYATPDGTLVPATGYRYMDSKYFQVTSQNMEAPLSYFSTSKFPTGSSARDGLQIFYEKGNPYSWSDARLVGKFDTLQLITKEGNAFIKIPLENQDIGRYLEPFTRYYPEYGIGGHPQYLPINKVNVTFEEVLLLPE
ncbi:MAG: RHS repeat-associated core domain-containing protein [Phycisphaerae bacterium]|nr:RHS repeat-associated core domain-containing protein [Phycisphaerae bacterium]